MTEIKAVKARMFWLLMGVQTKNNEVCYWWDTKYDQCPFEAQWFITHWDRILQLCDIIVVAVIFHRNNLKVDTAQVTKSSATELCCVMFHSAEVEQGSAFFVTVVEPTAWGGGTAFFQLKSARH